MEIDLGLNEVSLCRPLLLTTKTMAKKKKAKGKVRKAKKAAVDAAGVVVSPVPVTRVVSWNDEHEASLGPLLSLLSQVRLRAAKLRLRKPINVSSLSASLPCTHGWNPSEFPHGHDCHIFIEAALESLQNKKSVAKNVYSPKYPKIWSNSDRLDWIVSALIAIGTELVLQYGNDCCNYARVIAQSEALRQFQFKALHRIQPKVYCARVDDLVYADARRIVSYLKKRIPCSCLDAKYKEVKSMPKTGVCRNCDESEPRVEPSSLMSCGSCRKEHYCSKACQKADWKRHKEECNIWTEWLANNGGQPA